ncbi:discoidin domain-containing protein [Kribbella catacumbae]|uniref:discoidin domain-containing protein n=1 Tax=Kribbella catacumbae TaxID=460086 RepID=UPI00192C5DC1|nr:discoidin domain-containing protein [Kribbella catacumbae]
MPPTGNLAAGRPVTATSTVQNYVAGNTVDGNANSYWESANNSWPQSLTVDLGSNQNVKRLVLKLPPAWGARTQTIRGTRQHQRFGVQPAGRGHRSHLRPGRRQHGDDHLVDGGEHAPRPPHLHRQHRLAGGSAVGVRDL